MKVSAAALLFLILAAALGPPAHGYPGSGSPPQDADLGMQIHDMNQSDWSHLTVLRSFGATGVHRPSDCCPSYTPRNIRCGNMESFYKTSSACSQPAVIFLTKSRKKVCTNPTNERVQECMMKLESKNTLGNVSVDEKLH
ncbi:C-C motif chemokine 15-like [Phyllostomus hastatus]|uniref:C-C motif chemokine 15-like n=1 Tax=Phyllostomus hastatus TaxID=9423 RepID=UPI001E684CC6|nr:C-C motif chemokine 15-like [Phyllostomus hastatus]